jgi:surface antigen
MKSALGGLLILSSLACADAQTASSTQAPAQAQDAVVAEVAGRKITMKELDDRWQAMDAGERARVTQLLYQNRRNVLDQMLGDVLIEEAAKTAGMPVPQFLEQETKKRLQPVSEAETRQFYETNKDRTQGRTFEQLQGPIRDFLGGQRQAQAKAQLVDDLLKKTPGVRVLLDPPRHTIQLAAHDPSMGPPNAPVTIVEFSDYQ